MDINRIKQNKLKFILQFSIPSIIAMLLQTAITIFVATFLVMGFNVINSMYFTGCGDALSSATISSLRGIVLLLIFTFMFPALWGMTGVWLVEPVREILTAVVSLILINKQEILCEGR